MRSPFRANKFAFHHREISISPASRCALNIRFFNRTLRNFPSVVSDVCWNARSAIDVMLVTNNNSPPTGVRDMICPRFERPHVSNCDSIKTYGFIARRSCNPSSPSTQNDRHAEAYANWPALHHTPPHVCTLPIYLQADYRDFCASTEIDCHSSL